MKDRLKLSLIVVEHNMRREIPRTILSLSPSTQSIPSSDYEIIVVDNGSTTPSEKVPLALLADNVKSIRIDTSSVSPARAANAGLSAASGNLIGIILDGARMASPGLLSAALGAYSRVPRSIISPLAFHLGPRPQSQSTRDGYDQEIEDRLLNVVDWQENAYRLFEISALAGGNAGGWYKAMPESTAMFMQRALWEEIDGYDEGFQCPGGGLLTLDVYRRACALPEISPIMLLGEATFHQFHNGATTAKKEIDPWTSFHAEYVKLRGRPYEIPEYTPMIYHRPQPVTSLPNIRAAIPEGAQDNPPILEATTGQIPYLEVLSNIHKELRPQSYLEIGVRHGRSLSLAKCASIGVDPAAHIMFPLNDQTVVVNQTSDDFFASSSAKPKADLAFIDGLHSFEQALRDFINVEKISKPQTVVVFDDIFPNHPLQASRLRKTNVWTGDVWKILPCLKTFRPDLKLLALDTSPTGLMLVAGLNPDDASLNTYFDFIVDRYMKGDLLHVPPHILARHGAVCPTDDCVYEFLKAARQM
jgi:glycosyltransferase involved in cell wall biosynthesis